MREQNIRDILGSGIKFHEDLDRIKKEALVGVKFKLVDGKVVDDWDGKFGTSEFALLEVELEDEKRYTTLCGGKAVVRQVSRLLRHNKLPGRIWCFLNLVAGENGDYYLLDWQEGAIRKDGVLAQMAEPEVPAEPAEKVEVEQ